MKLLFLTGFFSLIFFGCGQGENPSAENQEKEVNGSSIEKLQELVRVFTITHQADNDEDVLISYGNPNNGKKAERFEVQPGQCLKFTEEQFQFIKNIKFGAGGFGFLDDNTEDVFNVICGSLLVEDEEEGHIDRPVSDKLAPCSTLANSHYEIKDEGQIFDDYVLKKSEENLSKDCQFFEDVLSFS